MRALTIHPIWLHMITRPAARGFSPKRVENRTDRNGNAGQPCHHRGPLLLHASAKQARREYDDVLRQLVDEGMFPADERPELKCGGIVAYTTVLGHLRPDGTAGTVDGELTAARVRKRFDLRWWRGDHALLLGDVEGLPFVGCKGALNTWRVQPEILAQLERQLGRTFPAAA